MTPTRCIWPPAHVEAGPRRKRWTRAEIEAIESAGLLPQERLELIEGELMDRRGKTRPRAIAISEMVQCLWAIFGSRFVQQAAAIDVSPEDNPSSEPVPDVIVLKRPLTDFRVDNPGPADLALVCQVSDSSLGFDLSTKANLYARAGIEEYWVLDLQGRKLIVHREPSSVGYKSLHTYLAGEKVAPLAAPGATIAIDDLLG